MPNGDPSDQFNTLGFQQRLVEVVQALAASNEYFPQGALFKLLDIAQVDLSADLARLILFDDQGTAIDTSDDDFVDTELDRRVEKAILEMPTQVVKVDPGKQSIYPTIMSAALRVGERVLGALWLGFGTPHVLSQEGDLYLQLLADHAALALAHLKIGASNAATRPISDKEMVENFPLPMMLLDDKFVIQYLNRGARKALGLDDRDGAGILLSEVIHDDAFVSFTAGEKDTQELARSYVSLGERVFQMSTRRLRLESHAGWRIIAMVDVSHFKRLNENMTMFLQTVSHDLRSPLTAAKGFVDMLPMVGEVNERQGMMLDKVTTSIVDMTNLVEKVLDAGRLDPEMGAYEIRREVCDPAEIIEKVASSLTPSADKKNLTLQAEAEGGIPAMNLDAMMIERSLTNLVENAIKYTPEGGSVWVRVESERTRLTFSVEDNGLGIPPEKLPSLFERGSRVRREEHKSIRGSGLGLFIVKNVAQQHGGDANVESVEGRGSIFRIVIPFSGPNTIGGS